MKRQPRPAIVWTPSMIEWLQKNYATSFNKFLASRLGCGWRSVVRKARELGLEKEPGFLDKNRLLIKHSAIMAHGPHPHKGEKGWCVPNSESTRFKSGTRNVKCKISAWNCVYHACMSDHCQRRFLIEDNKTLGAGKCAKKPSNY